jgi:hypothetical protein
VFLTKYYFSDRIKEDKVDKTWGVYRCGYSAVMWGRGMSMYGKQRGAYRVLVGKLEGNKPLSRPR